VGSSCVLELNWLFANIRLGQAGRALGPLIFCTLYWWAGREAAYAMGAAGMVAVAGLVFGGLKVPPGTENVSKKAKSATK
jgi:hypothetical protein